MTGVSDTVIRVENLGKKYIIGHQKQGRSRYTALRDVLADGTKSIGRRILNPFAPQLPSPTREEFWALKDVSFEIKQGDRVGIIGRNGAGKSTLLKLLSRITEPTTGRISVKGRVASLLEVGTGFHPELTGRENIYLNGAILGMSKAEIKKKFDEIVDFAEVEKFLDTPVKLYSSGMYVRLAFAVAAHLEPEVLVVDEVLAVGDFQFQNKCLNKMEDVGKEGRTIFFVSHNMGTVQQLCSKGVLLEQGHVKAIASPSIVIDQYLQDNPKNQKSILVRQGNKKIMFEDFFINDKRETQRTDFFMGETIYVNFSLCFYELVKQPIIAVEIRNQFNESLAHLINVDDDFHINNYAGNQKLRIKVEIPEVLLTPSTYLFSLWVGENMDIACDYLPDCMSIELMQGDKLRRATPYPSHVKVFLKSKWQRIERKQ
jgi:lipopolysaccharide transport system ATP-binding protein